jgi:hypothetical protein
VFEQSRFANTRIIQPPYTPRTEKILKLIQRFL